MKNPLRHILASLAGAAAAASLLAAAPWSPDNGDGTYSNPILFADYSDPDIERVGDDFYMTASSFNCVPGLPILHSKDLVNWELINHAIPRFPDNRFDAPQHGSGVWAPSIRFHDGWYYIYWGDPDRGIFRVQTQDPRGEWSAPILVKDAIGNIDPCPLWDDDGKVYLAHAFANSRSGIGDTLQVQELAPDGASVIRNRRIVYNDPGKHPTLEGPKFYKRNGYYYIFAPAGGVATGWQAIFRSRSVFGPYEERTVLATGDTKINGPHQGGYVELDNGEGWFVHFQEAQPYGRIVHLQPVKWVDDWPVIGEDPDGDGIGQPVLRHRKPNTPVKSPPVAPAVGDAFDADRLSLAWQWHANWHPHWSSLKAVPGKLRLHAQGSDASGSNLWQLPNLLLQKLPASSFVATAAIDGSGLRPGERAGLVVMGIDYALLSCQRSGDGALELRLETRKDAHEQKPEKLVARMKLASAVGFLRVAVSEGGFCQFSYSADDAVYTEVGGPFQAREGRWIGAKIGLVAQRQETIGQYGHADFDYFRIE